MGVDFATTGQHDVILFDHVIGQDQLVNENLCNSARLVCMVVVLHAAASGNGVVWCTCCQDWQSCLHISNVAQVGLEGLNIYLV